MDIRKAIESQTDFSLHLSNHISSKHASSNLVFSPLSVHVILSLIASGSKDKTLAQLTAFLRSSSKEDISSLSSQIVALLLAGGSSSTDGPRISFVNGVWVDQSLPLKSAFKEVLLGTYRAEAKNVDFQTKAAELTKDVNLWVSKETNGLIEELLPSGSVNGNTRLVFGNALYFKQDWAEKFDSSKTKDYDFTLLDGNPIKVPFMTSEKKQFVSAFDGFKVLKLPYKQGEDKRQFSMYVLLPDAKDGLQSLFEKLGAESGFLDRILPKQKVPVSEFRIPKFKISFGFEASGILKELGLDLPFGGEADLTEMVDSSVGQNLSVSNIFHKSFIEVNEEGTEASSASAAVITLRGIAPPPVDFVADHPFVFLIREDMTGVVMFTGHVINPLVSVF